jgi:hypothetical protein
MKNFFIFLLGAITGGIACLVLASGYLTGIGAGVGIATGYQAGVCLAVEAARSEGLITAEQVDQVLNATGTQLTSEKFTDPAPPPGEKPDCEKVLANLRQPAGKAD